MGCGAGQWYKLVVDDKNVDDMVPAMETDLTPQIVRDRATAARVPLSHVLKLANVSHATFYRWENGTKPRPLTLAMFEDALAAAEAGR